MEWLLYGLAFHKYGEGVSEPLFFRRGACNAIIMAEPLWVQYARFFLEHPTTCGHSRSRETFFYSPAPAIFCKWEYDLQRSLLSIRPQDALARESRERKLEVRVPSNTVREEVIRGLDHRSAARDLPW